MVPASCLNDLPSISCSVRSLLFGHNGSLRAWTTGERRPLNYTQHFPSKPSEPTGTWRPMSENLQNGSSCYGLMTSIYSMTSHLISHALLVKSGDRPYFIYIPFINFTEINEIEFRAYNLPFFRISHLSTRLQNCSNLHFHYAVGQTKVFTPSKLGKNENSSLISSTRWKFIPFRFKCGYKVIDKETHNITSAFKP